MTVNDWSAAVFVQCPDGVPAIRKRLPDGSWGDWHLPGGKKDPHERTVKVTALRELWEETGIDGNDKPFEILYSTERCVYKKRSGKKSQRIKHCYILHFCAIAMDKIERDPLRSTDIHEQARVIPFDEYRTMKNFSRLHRGFIKKHGLVPAMAKAA